VQYCKNHLCKTEILRKIALQISNVTLFLKDNTTFAGIFENKRSMPTIEKEKYLKEMQPLLAKKISKEIDNLRSICIGFTKRGNEHLYSDTFGRAKDLEKDDLKYLDSALENDVFLDSATVSKKRQDSITKFYYFKDKDKDLYYNVAEMTYKGSVCRFLYSVTNSIKKQQATP
jgi:hypothetical protein